MSTLQTSEHKRRRSFLRIAVKLIVLFGSLWAGVAVHRCSAQTPPRLALQFSTQQPTLNITGQVGAVCSIESAEGLSARDRWAARTLLQVQVGGTVWTDSSAATQRFYRAVSAPAVENPNRVFIEPGTFMMGSPTTEPARSADENQHAVVISRGFRMGKYLVTQGDYLAVVGSNPSFFTSAHGYPEDLTRPVEAVSWSDATNYCALRTRQEWAVGAIPTNYIYRLPSESEWEYACRAGTTTVCYLGDALRSGQANFNGQAEYDAALGGGIITNPTGIFLQKTTPVGSYAPNAWGLYDMIGNVWEWCQDWYDLYPAGTVTDPQGPTSLLRARRG